jgi:CheY-like chemotaxis protein
MCDSLEALLQPEPYTTAKAQSGHQALNLISGIRFDLILMDYVLPDIPGSQLLHDIRERSPESALIVMTGYASVDKAVDALRGGSHDFLQKPFDYVELKEKISSAIRSTTNKLRRRKAFSEFTDDFDKPILVGGGLSGLSNNSPPEPNLVGLVQKAYAVPPHLPVIKVKEFLQAGNPIYSVIVVENKKPIGLVMNIHLDRMLSHRFGFSLYRDKPIRQLMDSEPVIIEGKQSIEEAANLAMSRNVERLYDHLIVTTNGTLIGTVSVRRILQTLSRLMKNRTVKLERAYRNLQDAHYRIKTLSGMLPICSHCKKIRDDRGYWNQLEEYISEHSQAEFSHGICPECVKKHYPDYDPTLK